MICVKQRD
jgi:division protein CdvB (Snf7/Vps24/ESCRT-III family)